MPERLLYDFLTTMEGGVNSDLHPILLPKNVAAWTINSTLRGGFPRPRPPLYQITLSFPTDEVEELFNTGFYQGGGYYRPDFGTAQLVVQVSGRLFTLTEVSDSAWDVVEITIPGDPNNATTNQVWMNQAEKWLIISDGTDKLPIFWDGVAARRSYGPSVELGELSAPITIPEIGDSVAITLVADYAGIFNVPVLLGGFSWQVASSTTTPGSPGSYNVTVTPTSNNDAGTIIPSGSNIVVSPTLIGKITAVSDAGNPTINGVCGNNVGAGSPTVSTREFFIGINNPQTSIKGQSGCRNPNTITIRGAVWHVTEQSFGSNNHPIRIDTPFSSYNPSNAPMVGDLVYYSESQGPDTILGQAPQFTVPPVGSNVTFESPQLYSGPAGAVVWIGGVRFTIKTGETVAPIAPTTTINLINIDAVPLGGAVAAGKKLISIPELPAGRMGAYGLGHQAWSLVDGISFIYGDAVGGPSGTPAFNYRDSVLKTTENDFLTGGGSFRIPNSGEIITSMTFTAILDAAYGQGPLLLGTPTAIFSCAVPTDRAAWIALTNPILTEVLIGKGPLAQNSTVPANSDTIFRSSEGLGSLIFGRRDFETWGNTPISAEMTRTVDQDIRSLLSYGSAVTFDNRLLSTAAPQVSGQGVYHIGTLALNFDPVSSLRGKAPSIWESLWVKTNVLQYIVGIFNSVERCFQFTFNQIDNKIELWEQKRTDNGEYFDNGTERIPWVVETPCIFKPEERPQDMPIVRLVNGKIHLSKIVGTVRVKVLYRPDFWPCWVPWHEFDVCANVDAENADNHPGYLTPIGLGEPSPTPCEQANDRPMRSARFFQLRLEFIGQCVFMGGEFAAVPEPNITFPAPPCNVTDDI